MRDASLPAFFQLARWATQFKAHEEEESKELALHACGISSLCWGALAVAAERDLSSLEDLVRTLGRGFPHLKLDLHYVDAEWVSGTPPTAYSVA
jgi:hypothetical protein